ncbi:hypothetical protein C8A00DRAFT_41867 [Chaetomidium leptoderma]|uniref:Uncharacterized protein n=1 Tax=Chaetomidium leptoderma TaxID=669021 RepID=A0AAN6VSH0_9PEZI|nr:hypothetical protein C8A00DRAFT_41867 [Chaetomidium leptoderma]
MAPLDLPRARRGAQRSVSSPEAAGQSGAPSPQRRNDGQLDATGSGLDQRLMMSANPESWVEVASQPSSSSLSSIGDDIVTTGLRVGSTAYPPRRRRPQPQHPMPASFIVGHPATQGGATSSQEEYDETESEEDRVMTSSTEAIHPSANLLRQQATARASAVITDSDSDDDENATALGRPSNGPVFRPQPNAFSHPPSHITHRHSTGSAPYHHHHHHPSHSRPSMTNRPHSRSHRGPPNYMSPSYQADNDAALRASLTTLLSCAAAARGLPKHEERRTTVPGGSTGVIPSSQPMELRLVPESELMADDGPPPPPPTSTTTAAAVVARTASNSSAPSAPSSSTSGGRDYYTEKTKRPAATTQSRPARATKKKRTTLVAGGGGGGGGGEFETATATDADTAPFFFNVSPTLLTWVVSAGVVVLVSVVGFGAGYVIGREVGRQESAVAASSLGGGGGFGSSGGAGVNTSAAAGCGGELVRAGGGGGGSSGTLRRIRWGGGGVGKSVAA